jgi:hypothetical protein
MPIGSPYEFADDKFGDDLQFGDDPQFVDNVRCAARTETDE